MAEFPILYSFRRCPYAMRARLALMVSGTVCELREVKLSAKPDDLIAISPKATVPVLQLPGGELVDESIDIMRWALARNDPENWLERDDAALIAANDGPFKHHLDRYKYPGRYDDCDAGQHRESGLKYLQVLEERLKTQPQLCGRERGLADMAIMPFIRQFAATDWEWFADQRLPGLQAWLDGHLESPLFKSVMDKRQPWAPGDAPVYFPAG
ncbi:glutathione S-transferase [Allopontixanthobacter sediminis]|uniref:Glutathione S-transferase n=1 Tax=Allopontixanthobacter sediminis TaxID=1689985 RepID=A0A845AZV9_9SPHN|nr:glutathione S-transferase [Allopontixanthobacter sediminis]MXP45023.1 glutathione S-transferase [Allopontixanthobacter sediminis]